MFALTKMLRHQIDIADKWHIMVCYGNDNLRMVGKLMLRMGASKHQVRDAIGVLRRLNTGMTYSVLDRRESLVVISNATSREQFVNSLAHEAKHVQSHICKYYHVSETGERAAYLLGYIIQLMYSYLKDMMR